jgi:hypothetical protein
MAMPDLSFQVTGSAPAAYAAAPSLVLQIRIDNAEAEEEIRAVSLACQIRVETARRQYTETEKQRLRDLFGEPARWGRTLRSMLWAQATVTVPPFQGSTTIDLPVACTFDLTVATAKYLNGVEDGCVPLALLFSGSVFYSAEDGALQVAQIPWNRDAAYALPVAVWKQMMDAYYPNTAWVCLRRDVAERLDRYRTDRGMATWEQALESILP